MSDDVLMKHIEYGMPKLEKRRRKLSETDSCIVYDQNPEYFRSISRITASTDVPDGKALEHCVV